jgi:heat-inducible transcriptional repressor
MQERLSARQRWVLKAIVEEYVTTATPVSSEQVARRTNARVSTATLRHEMAQLEDLGLLQHPHTSAGRRPSDAGYRFYVEELMEPLDLGAAERRTIRHQFHQVEFAIDEWLALARAVLAQTLHNAALATPPLALQAKLRRIELVPLQDHSMLLIWMLQSGHIRQQVLRTEAA